MSARAVFLAAGAALGLALSAVATLLVLASDHEDNKAATIALAVTAGFSFIASGLVALWRRPDNRTGYLLAAVGFVWFFGALTESNNDWLFTIGAALSSLVFGVFVHLLLAFPGGRLTKRRDLWLVVSTYAIVLTSNVALLLLEEVPDPTSCPQCRSTIAIGQNDGIVAVVDAVTTTLGLALLVTLLAIVVTRFLRSRGALRRALGPVLGAGALATVILMLQLSINAYSEGAAQPLEYVFLAAFAAVPLAFLMGVLRSRLARSGVGDLLLALGRGIPIRDALADALADPTLEIGYWLPDQNRYVSADGKPLPDEPDGRAVTLVEHAGRPTAALLHDPLLADQPELVDAVAAAAGLWLDNERLQAKLRTQVEFLEAIVNASPSLLCSVNREGRIANLNDAAWWASGYVEESEVKGQPFWDVFVGPEARSDSRRWFEQAAPAHEPARFEHTFVNQLDETLTIAWSTAPLHDENGGIRYVVCGGLDITERERQHQQLQASEERLRAAIEASPVAIVEYALDDTITRWNPAAERIFGWTAEQVIGGTAKHQPPGREAELADLFRRVRAGEVYTGVESTRVRSDGTSVEVAIAAAPIRDPNGEVVSHMALFADISERKRQHQQLQASEERLRAAIEASPVAIVEYGLDDTISRWNPAAERIFGWTAEQVIGGTPKHRPAERDHELAELFRRVRAGEVYTSLETERLRKDGSLIDVEMSTAPIFNDAGDVVSYMALYADITDRKRQDEEVRASRARIVEAGDGARRRLERNLHDGAQQRLVALSLSLRLAQSKLDTDPVAAEAVLEGARTELAAALDELRELARGIHPAVLTDRGLAAAVEALAARSPVPVDVEISDGPLPQAVEAAAYYVIAESLANVAKYANALRVMVRVHREDERALVEVADDGAGGADPTGGSGLRGLADRVEALGGTLKVYSPRGGGTCVNAVIPLHSERPT